MASMLVLLLAVSPTIYAAKVATFGCTSSEEVANLLRLRGDAKAFQTELQQQFFNGECVEIAKDEIVEGAVDATDPSMLEVDRRMMPPGYLAPSADFAVKTAQSSATEPRAAERKPADGKP